MANLLVDWLNKGKNPVGNVGLKGIVGQNGVNVTGVNNKQSSTNPTGNINSPVSILSNQLSNMNGITQTGTPTVNKVDTTQSQVPSPSRFIGFQQPKFQNTTIGSTKEQEKGLSFGKLTSGQYNIITTPTRQAEIDNAKEEARYRTVSEALIDLQGDLFKNKKVFSEADLKRLYPEFKDNFPALDELQKELLPMVSNGEGVALEKIEEKYPELLQPKKLQNIEEVAKQEAKDKKEFEKMKKGVDEALRKNAGALSIDGLKYLKGADTLLKALDQYKKQGNIGSSDVAILNDAIKNNPELQKIKKDMDSYNLTEKDKALLGKNASFWGYFKAAFGEKASAPFGEHEKYNQQDIDNIITAKQNTPGFMDTVTTFGQQRANNVDKFLYRDTVEINTLNEKLKNGETDLNKAIQETRKEVPEKIKAYNEIVNKEFENSIAKKINAESRQYYDSKGITELLAEGDTKGATYKMTKSVAENRQMIPEMVLTAVTGGAGSLFMMGDIYVQENQGTYEDMIEEGATHEEAEKGAVVVGLVNAAIERYLDEALGGVQRAGSQYLRTILGKEVRKEVVQQFEKGALKGILKQGIKDWGKGSVTEGLEEVVQTVVSNAAVKAIGGDRDLFEGGFEAFEGAFYNPLNAVGGATSIISNAKKNQEQIGNELYKGAEKVGQATRTLVNGVQNVSKNTRSLLTKKVADKGQQVQEQQQSKDKADTPKNDSETSKIWDYVTGIDDNTSERLKSNPYAAQEVTDLIDEIETNPGMDFGYYQAGRYEEVLGDIVDKLTEKENKRKNEVGPLYQQLEEANTVIDPKNLQSQTSSIRNRLAENDGIITSAEQTKINKLIEGIEKLGDGTKDIWKLRKEADQWASRGSESTQEGVRLIREIRNMIDEEIRAQVPEMKEVDTEYRKIKDEISDLRGNLINKKTGKLRDNAVSSVKNLLNPSNRLFLERLEKEIPGITKQLQAISDSKFVFNAYTTGNGSRFISGIAKGVAGDSGKIVGSIIGSVFGNVSGGIIGASLGHLIDKKTEQIIGGLTRKAIKKVFTKETAKSKAELDKIMQKIEEGKNLNAKDKAKLQEISKKIAEAGEKAKKTRAEQKAWDKVMEKVKKDQSSLKLPNKGGTDGGKNILTNGKTIITDNNANSKVKGQISEIDKRKPSETKTEEKKNIVTEKAKITEKKTEDKKLDTKVEDNKKDGTITKDEFIKEQTDKARKILDDKEMDVSKKAKKLGEIIGKADDKTNKEIEQRYKDNGYDINNYNEQNLLEMF